MTTLITIARDDPSIHSVSCYRWFDFDDRRQWQAVRRRGREWIDGIGGDCWERGQHGLASQELAEETETPRYPQSWLLRAQPDLIQERLAEESAYTDALDGSLANAFLSPVTLLTRELAT